MLGSGRYSYPACERCQAVAHIFCCQVFHCHDCWLVHHQEPIHGGESAWDPTPDRLQPDSG